MPNACGSVLKVTIITQYFPPEIGAPQARLSEFAREWTALGADVTVLTGMPNHPTGVVPPDYRGELLLKEQRDGYRVVRTWLYATPNEGIIRKTLSHLSFMITAVVLGFTWIGRPDVVVVSSPTFFSMFSAWIISRVKRAPLVVEVRDLWPALFVELGVIENKRIIGLLEKIELAMYRAADRVVVVSEGFRDNIAARGIPRAKIETIRNGVDLDRFDSTVPASKEVREKLGAPHEDEVLVLYIGAHGISQGLTAVADAAAKVDDPRVRFAFVGEGAAKEELRERVRQLHLDNVVLHGGVPRQRVPEMLAAADICLVPLRDVPIFSTFIPSKIFEYLGSGKAVVGSVRGEAAEILEAAGARVVEPEDAPGIADAIKELAADPALREEMGASGRAYVEAEFDRTELARRYYDLLQEVVDGVPA